MRNGLVAGVRGVVGDVRALLGWRRLRRTIAELARQRQALDEVLAQLEALRRAEPPAMVPAATPRAVYRPTAFDETCAAYATRHGQMVFVIGPSRAGAMPVHDALH